MKTIKQEIHQLGEILSAQLSAQGFLLREIAATLIVDSSMSVEHKNERIDRIAEYHQIMVDLHEKFFGEKI